MKKIGQSGRGTDKDGGEYYYEKKPIKEPSFYRINDGKCKVIRSKMKLEKRPEAKR